MKFRLLIINYRIKRFVRQLRFKKIVISLVFIFALLQLWQGSYIYIKSIVAQYLIASSWDKTLLGQDHVKPWSWADTWPVAKLTMLKYNVSLLVLAGDNGRTLAFGPGYRFGTDLPGGNGLSMISGHRDTHFSFLREVAIHDNIKIQNISGATSNYQITETKIVSARDAIMFDTSESQLLLVTCYPFDSMIVATDLRYIVIANKTDDI